MGEMLPSGGGNWASQACTLPTVERPVRMAEFDELFATSVRRVERVGGGAVRLTLTPEPSAAGRAADLMVRETACCSFFSFALRASGGELALEVSAPAEHLGVLDAVADRAAAAAGAS